MWSAGQYMYRVCICDVLGRVHFSGYMLDTSRNITIHHSESVLSQIREHQSKLSPTPKLRLRLQPHMKAKAKVHA